jgi:hypothetical protein
MGPMPAPKGKTPHLSISAEEASRLAYYSMGGGIGALAPRGWYCFGTYGSGGMHLAIRPHPIHPKDLFAAHGNGFTGPAVQLDYSYGVTSGRFSVAQTIARVFPAYQWFATRVDKEVSPSDRFPFGQYPADALTYRNDRTVEFTTPPDADGLGTSVLRKDDDPIVGVATLVEKETDLMLLAVRLPPDLAPLSTPIIREVETAAQRRAEPARLQPGAG